MIKEKNLASLRKTTYICRKSTLATKGQKMQKLALATISADIQSIDVIEEQKLPRSIGPSKSLREHLSVAIV